MPTATGPLAGRWTRSRKCTGIYAAAMQYVSTTSAYEFSGKSALRSIELEIPMSPVKGSSSSKTRKIAPANDSAHDRDDHVRPPEQRGAHKDRAEPKYHDYQKRCWN